MLVVPRQQDEEDREWDLDERGLDQGFDLILVAASEHDVEPGVAQEQRRCNRRSRRRPCGSARDAPGRRPERHRERYVESDPGDVPVVARVPRGKPVGQDERPRNEHRSAEHEQQCCPTGRSERLGKRRHERVVPRDKALSEAVRRSVWNRCEQVFASPYTTAADLGADSTVLVVGGKLLALLGARPTGCRARLDLRAEDADVRLGLPDQDAAGGLAGVGAVEAESNAADQLRDIWLREVGVRAARARRRAVEALFDAAHQRVTIENGGARVGLEHVSNSHVLSLLWRFYRSQRIGASSHQGDALAPAMG